MTKYVAIANNINQNRNGYKTFKDYIRIGYKPEGEDRSKIYHMDWICYTRQTIDTI